MSVYTPAARLEGDLNWMLIDIGWEPLASFTLAMPFVLYFPVKYTFCPGCPPTIDA